MRTLVLLGCLAVATEAVAQVQLVPIPRHPRYGSINTRAMSGDGSVVVGYCYTGRDSAKAVVWDRVSGAFDAIPDGTPAGSYTMVSGCSADGSVVVGTCRAAEGQRGYVWRRGVGVSLLDPAVPGGTGSTGNAVSGDGLVFGGDSFLPRVASIWSPGQPARVIEGTDETGPCAFVRAISADGRTAVGVAWGGAAFVWREGEGCGLVPPLPGAAIANNLILTAGGDAVYGVSGGVGFADPFVWSRDIGTLPLGNDDGSISQLTGATADGRILVGRLRSGVAMVHTFGVGTVTLAEYLNRFGASFQDTDFWTANGISDAGDVIWTWTGPVGERLVILPPLGLADFNADVMTDFHDLSDYLDCFEGLGPLPVSSADLNRDGITDFFDLIEFYDRFGG